VRIRQATAAAVLALLVLAGCAGRGAARAGQPGPKSSGGSGASGGSETAAQELAAALDTLRTNSYRYSVTAPVSASQTLHSEGAVDPGGPALTATASVPAARGTTSIDVVLTGTDLYVRYPPGFALNGGQWLHVDGKRIALSKLGLVSASDPAGAADYAKMIVSVERDGDHHYKGTLDLTQSPRFALETQALGGKATAVPFEATTDDKRRLSSLTVTTTSGGKDVPVVTTFSDYGTKVDAAKPAGSVEAPDALYKALGA